MEFAWLCTWFYSTVFAFAHKPLAIFSPLWKYWNGKAISVVSAIQWRHEILWSKDEYEATDQNFSCHFLIFISRYVKQLKHGTVRLNPSIWLTCQLRPRCALMKCCLIVLNVYPWSELHGIPVETAFGVKKKKTKMKSRESMEETLTEADKRGGKKSEPSHKHWA